MAFHSKDHMKKGSKKKPFTKKKSAKGGKNPFEKDGKKPNPFAKKKGTKKR